MDMDTASVVDATAQVHDEQLSRRSEHEQHLRAVVSHAPIALFTADRDGTLTRSIGRGAALGFGDGASIGRSVFDLYRDVPEIVEHTRLALAGQPCRTTVRMAGEVFEIGYLPTYDGEGRPVGCVGVATDVTTRVRAEDALALQYAVATLLGEADTLAESVPTLLQVICWSQGWEAGIFWVADEAAGLLRPHDLWHAPSIASLDIAELGTLSLSGAVWPRQGWPHGRSAAQADMAAASEAAPHYARLRARGLRGAVGCPVVTQGTTYALMEFFSRDPVAADNALTRAMTTIGLQVGQFVGRTRAVEAARHEALHDGLTGLPNRTLFYDCLEAALDSARIKRTSMTLLIVDLDGFGRINAALGYQRADTLLREIALRLRRVLRRSDTVARLGGDRFAVILPATTAAGATRALHKVLAALSVPCVLDVRSIVVGGSVGVAVYPDHGSDTTALLRHADRTMVEAKGYRGGHAVRDTARHSSAPVDEAARSPESGKEAHEAPPPTVLQFYRKRSGRTPPSSR